MISPQQPTALAPQRLRTRGVVSEPSLCREPVELLRTRLIPSGSLLRSARDSGTSGRLLLASVLWGGTWLRSSGGGIVGSGIASPTSQCMACACFGLREPPSCSFLRPPPFGFVFSRY